MFCQHCGKPLKKESRFCTECGKATGGSSQLGESDGNDRRGTSQKMNKRTKLRKFNCSLDQYENIVTELENWLESQNFDLQRLRTNEGDILMQIRKKGGWKKLVGMSTALSILCIQSSESLTVEIGESAWADKAVAAGVSWFFLWPLVITSAVGAWDQMKMPQKVFDFIESQLR